jgi:hypothetical protein
MVDAQTPWFGDGLCTSGDHERGLLVSLCHCLTGGVFLPSHNKIHDTTLQGTLKGLPILQHNFNNTQNVKFIHT